MQVPRSVIAITLLGLVVGACGGTPAGATQGPGGATQAPGGGTATQAPAATQSGGGGGVILPGNGSGQVRYEISGPVEKAGEMPFFGVGSRFGGEAGQFFSFTDTDAATEIISIFPAQDSWLIGYTSEEFQVSATACEITNWQTSATSASGTFDCQNAIVTKPDGTSDTTGRIKGTFEARA